MLNFLVNDATLCWKSKIKTKLINEKLKDVLLKMHEVKNKEYGDEKSFILRGLPMHQLEKVLWKSMWILIGLLLILFFFRNGIIVIHPKIRTELCERRSGNYLSSYIEIAPLVLGFILYSKTKTSYTTKKNPEKYWTIYWKIRKKIYDKHFWLLSINVNWWGTPLAPQNLVIATTFSVIKS